MNRLAAALGPTLAAGLLLASAVAHADTFDVTNVAVPLAAGGIDITYGSLTYNGVIAGQIQLTGTLASAPTGPAFIVNAWCVDLFDDIYLGANSYAYVIAPAVTTDSNGNTLSSTVSAELATLATYGNTLLAGPNAGDANMSSAIQLAIWQTEYPGFTYVANDTVSTDVVALEAYAAANTQPGAALDSLSGAQNLITSPFGASGTSSDQIPEPASLLIFGTGLLGLGLTRRRA
jgi:hypothetical protein